MPMEPRVPVLQIRQLWGDNVVDTRHFRPSVGSVRVGDRMGWRWELLGVDMGFVPEPLHKVLPWLPPLWSEVGRATMVDFATDEDALGGAEQHTLYRYDEALGWLISAPGAELAPVGASPVRLRLGHTVFEARVVAAAQRTERPVWALEGTMAGSLGMMAGIGLCFGILVATAPAPAETLMLDATENVYEALLKLPPEPPVEKKAEVVKPAENPEVARASRSRNKVNDQLKRGGKGKARADREKAQSAGLFSSEDLLKELLGSSSDLSSTLVSATGVMVAKGSDGGGFGVHGLGDRGGLSDGGGNAEELGGISPWGDGGPPGTGNDGFGDGKGKPNGVIGGVDGTPLLIGNLSADQVDRVVRGHLQQIRYCYQRELGRSPSLQGKLSIGFTIASDGTVAAARAKTNTLGNEAVESCVVARFLKMQFPMPEGGGIAVVNYPFVFAPG